MLRRLILAWLIACLAAPAVAAGCASNLTATPPMAADSMGTIAAPSHAAHRGATPPSDPRSAPAQAPVSHDCIGCIAPFHGLARLGAPVAVPPAIPPLPEQRFTAGRPLVPDPPPPRGSV